VNRDRVSSEAMKWVIWIQTARSLDKLWPVFERWLLADRENWNAYIQARRELSRWDPLKGLLSKDRKLLSETLALAERKRAAARSHRQVLWAVLAVSVLALLLG
jgi:ferric-dicitrate binding protein FerR (iron transport regulator)